MQTLLFLCALAAVSAIDSHRRVIPNVLCLLTAAAGLFAFSPARLWGMLAALPLLTAALLRPGCIGGGDIKFTAAAGSVLGLERGLWGLAWGLGFFVLYYAGVWVWRRLTHREQIQASKVSLPMGPCLSIGFAAMYFGR